MGHFGRTLPGHFWRAAKAWPISRQSPPAVKAALFLIVEILFLLLVRAAIKARGSQERQAFRKALSEITQWKMPLWFPASLAGIILTAYVSAALKLSVWTLLELELGFKGQSRREVAEVLSGGQCTGTKKKKGPDRSGPFLVLARKKLHAQLTTESLKTN